MRVFFITASFLIVLFLGVFVSYSVMGYMYPFAYKDKIELYANEYDLQPKLVASVIFAESKFKKDVVSYKGAIGLMQIMPETGEWIAKSLNETFSTESLLNESINIRYGCYYLRYLLNKFENVDTALAAYNAGEGKVRMWLSDKEFSSDGKTLEKIPYNETRDYVEKINKRLPAYDKKFKEKWN